MKLLITGGAGFIGSQLTDYFLQKGYAVDVIDNLSWGKKKFFLQNLSNKEFRFIKGDLLNYKTLKNSMDPRIDTVFHLAANSDIMRGAVDPEIDFKNTTTATFNLLKAMQGKKIKKIFYTSGSGVYGDVGSRYTGEEFGPLLPISMYGATKLSAEAMISAFVHLYDMQAWLLRPANIVGPRATHGVIFDFINKLKQNPKRLEVLGDGSQSKSYLYVDDVIKAINLIWKKSKSKISVYNIASNSFITVKEIANMVREHMRLANTKIIFGSGNRGWKGDVPVVRIKNNHLLKLGWKSNYTSRQAVKKTLEVLLAES